MIAYWAAQQAGQELLLRIDDLDSPRVKAWAVQQAIDDLAWLGIECHGAPVIQSSHQQHYQQILERLTDATAGLAYRCACSRNDIAEALSAPHESRFRGEGPIYPGICRPPDGRQASAEDSYWRLRASEQQLVFHDRVLGTQGCCPADELGDFPMTTRSGQVSYQLAVVIDDHLQGVDTVVRGNDLVASTFRQLQIHQLLGWDPPAYAHVPLVLGVDGRRLAKRHGDTRLSFYRENGVSASQVVGWAAYSLGLIDRQEPCAARDLITQFDWKKLSAEPTVIDPVTLFG
ncbi:Glutamate--tRNA ligase [Stieleria bergensis]|uniref:Glutamate--tRNA ligase n=1 Tax=Stieleria bergensis TaxID=2528025 RepID=A0A517SW94_9BACT|nr:Glutamate--tRNA ligase [Planctomycetes bacterium SV_7m_r]